MCRRGNAPRPKLRSLTRKLKKAKAILCLRTKHLNAHVFGAAVVEGVAEARPQKGVVARGQSSQQLRKAVAAGGHSVLPLGLSPSMALPQKLTPEGCFEDSHR